MGKIDRNKLEMLGIAMEVISKFAKTLGDVASIVPGDPKTAGNVAAGVKTIVKGVVEAITSGDAGFSKLVTVVLHEASMIKSPKGAEKKLKVLATVMEVVGKFADTLATVGKLAPQPSAIEGVSKKAPDLLTIISGIVSAVSTQLPALVKAMTGSSMSGLGDKTLPKKLKNLSTLMDSVSKFANVISQLGAMKAPQGVSALITEMITAIVDVTKADGPLPKLLVSIGETKWKAPAIKGNTKLLESVSKFLTEYSKVVEGMSLLSGGTGASASTALTAVTDDIEKVNASLAGLGPVDIKAKLSKFAQDAWKGDGKISIEHKPIILNVNMTVTMDAKKIAEGLDGLVCTQNG